MHAESIAAYVLSVAVLFLKLVVTISVQGITRMRSRTFQYPEDAAYWGGEERREEQAIVVRAQRLLRNDAEGQPFFFAVGAVYVAIGASPKLAPIYFGLYAASRLAHAWFLLRPRQPHRNRAFGVGLTVLLVMTVHTVLAALEGVRFPPGA